MAPREGGGYAMGFAGDTFNTAWYLRRLSGQDVAVDYLTAVGDDAVSKKMLDFMASAGVGTSLIGRRIDATVGLYLVSLENGERTFSYWRESSAARELDRGLDRLVDVAPETLVYFSGITLAILSEDGRKRLIGAMATSRRSGCTVAFDPNIRPRLWEDTPTLRHWIESAVAVADIALPSADDEKDAFGDESPRATAERYLGLGAGCVVVKDGANTVLLRDCQGGTEKHAPSPVDPVDTTAAGDAFNAGFLAALNHGDAYDVALAGGCDLAARVVRGRGALVES